ncbi:MAG: MBL fold metallo-hydrolase [Chitinophagales bacterium]|nr:MBL fold metallo-hydrolase [Chitinophagales bacterium]MDW8393505.1 MBL fold metallo-hydrolase [Chitinophagales bacterium]
MKITFLGTGTSQGIPVIACSCPVCCSVDPRDNRLRSSLLVTADSVQFCIDSGPDFRQQMLRSRVTHLDALLFTHAHKDHTAGLDDVRAFNYFSGQPMPVYATAAVQEAIRREFSYAFDPGNTYPGLPRIHFHLIENEPFFIGKEKIIPIKVYHAGMPVLGFRMGDVTYITDANYIPTAEMRKIQGSRIFIVNALRHHPHVSHFSLNEALEIARAVQAEQTFLTHISHQMGLHAEVEASLPTGIRLAYDMLTLELH